MPHYEFYGPACKKSFAQILRLVDYEEGDVVCPHCGSNSSETCPVPDRFTHVIASNRVSANFKPKPPLHDRIVR